MHSSPLQHDSWHQGCNCTPPPQQQPSVPDWGRPVRDQQRRTPTIDLSPMFVCRTFRKGGVITSLDEYTAVPSCTAAGLGPATVPPSGPPARLGPQIGISNVGYQLLKKAGWQEGQGLGSSQQGRSTPLAAYHQQAGQTGVAVAVLSYHVAAAAAAAAIVVAEAMVCPPSAGRSTCCCCCCLITSMLLLWLLRLYPPEALPLLPTTSRQVNLLYKIAVAVLALCCCCYCGC